MPPSADTGCKMKAELNMNYLFVEKNALVLSMLAQGGGNQFVTHEALSSENNLVGCRRHVSRRKTPAPGNDSDIKVNNNMICPRQTCPCCSGSFMWGLIILSDN